MYETWRRWSTRIYDVWFMMLLIGTYIWCRVYDIADRNVYMIYDVADRHVYIMFDIWCRWSARMYYVWYSRMSLINTYILCMIHDVADQHVYIMNDTWCRWSTRMYDIHTTKSATTDYWQVFACRYFVDSSVRIRLMASVKYNSVCRIVRSLPTCHTCP